MRKKGKSNQTLPPTLFSPTSTMADFNAVAQQFTNFYYSTFDSNRANLAPLYVGFLFFSPTPSSSSDSDLLIADLLPPLLSPKARLIYAHIRGCTFSRRCQHRGEADSEYFHIYPTCFEPNHPFFSFFPAQSLPFQKVQHKVTTRDAQPSTAPTSLIVSVTGLLLVSTDRKSPGAFVFGSTHDPPSRSTTTKTHCSSLKCSILSKTVGATTCTFILIALLLRS
jgi:hypothetical protein